MPPSRSVFVLGSTLGLLAVSAALAWSWPWVNVSLDPVLEWGGRVEEELVLGHEDEGRALHVARTALRSHADAPADPPSDLPEVFSLRDSRPVWVTLFPDEGPPVVGLAREANLYRSLRAAARAAASQHEGPASDPATWPLRVEILSGRDTLPGWLPLAWTLEPGVHGLHLRRGEDEVWMPPSQTLTEGAAAGVEAREGIAAHVLAAATRSLGGDDTSPPHVERLRVLEFAQAGAAGPVLTLQRGRPEVGELDAAALDAAATRAYAWLDAHVDADGALPCAYDPRTDVWAAPCELAAQAALTRALVLAAPEAPATQRALSRLRVLLDPRAHLAFERTAATPLPEDTVALAQAFAALASALIPSPPAARDEAAEARLSLLTAVLLAAAEAPLEAGDLPRAGAVVGALSLGGHLRPDGPLGAAADALAARIWRRLRWPGAAASADGEVVRGLALHARLRGDAADAGAVATLAAGRVDTLYPPNLPPWLDYLGLMRAAGALPRGAHVGGIGGAWREVLGAVWAAGGTHAGLEEALVQAARGIVTLGYDPGVFVAGPRPGASAGGVRVGLLRGDIDAVLQAQALEVLRGGAEVASRREAAASAPRAGER